MEEAPSGAEGKIFYMGGIVQPQIIYVIMGVPDQKVIFVGFLNMRRILQNLKALVSCIKWYMNGPMKIQTQ